MRTVNVLGVGFFLIITHEYYHHHHQQEQQQKLSCMLLIGPNATFQEIFDSILNV